MMIIQRGYVQTPNNNGLCPLSDVVVAREEEEDEEEEAKHNPHVTRSWVATDLQQSGWVSESEKRKRPED